MSNDPYLTIKGIVLREVDYGESSKMLTVFSGDHGIIRVSGRGVRKVKSKLRSFSQIFSFCEMDLYKNKGDVYTLTGGRIIDSFYGIASNMDAFYVAGKISRILLSVLQPALPDTETMRLTLNAFHYLASGTRNPRLVQVIFLIYFMQLQGVLPDAQTIISEYGPSLSSGAVKGLMHITESEMETLFRFTVSDTILDELESLSVKLENAYI